MQEQQLQATLHELHQELSTIDSVDDSTKQMLTTVMQDIAGLLTGEKPQGDSQGDPPSEAVRGLVTEFEAEHPKLAQIMGQLADGLANLGI